MTDQSLENVFQPNNNAHPHTPNVSSASHNIHRHGARAPSTSIEWDTLPDGVGSKTGNIFPSPFEKLPDSSSEVSKKQHRRKRYRKKSKDKCGEQLLAKPGDIGESGCFPGCSDFSVCPTIRLQTPGVCNHSAVDHTGLLQLTVGPDKPIKLATSVSLTQLPPHVPILFENWNVWWKLCQRY